MEVLQWPPRKHFYHQPYLYRSRHSHTSHQPSTDVSNTVASASSLAPRPLNIGEEGGLEKIEDVTSGLLGSTTNTIQQSRIWPASAAAAITQHVSRRKKRLQGSNILI